jgi:hypothetical protein
MSLFGPNSVLTNQLEMKIFFFGASPKNQAPSPRGYQLTTNSPEAEEAVPVGERKASEVAV